MSARFGSRMAGLAKQMAEFAQDRRQVDAVRNKRSGRRVDDKANKPVATQFLARAAGGCGALTAPWVIGSARA